MSEYEAAYTYAVCRIRAVVSDSSKLWTAVKNVEA